MQYKTLAKSESRTYITYLILILKKITQLAVTLYDYQKFTDKYLGRKEKDAWICRQVQ